MRGVWRGRGGGRIGRYGRRDGRLRGGRPGRRFAGIDGREDRLPPSGDTLSGVRFVTFQLGFVSFHFDLPTSHLISRISPSSPTNTTYPKFLLPGQLRRTRHLPSRGRERVRVLRPERRESALRELADQTADAPSDDDGGGVYRNRWRRNFRCRYARCRTTRGRAVRWWYESRRQSEFRGIVRG